MIKNITENKKELLNLLLLADEQESMIDRYLARGEMYALYTDNVVAAVCVVTDEGSGTLEIKNIVTAPKFRGKGFGRELIRFIIAEHQGSYRTLIVGTGDSPLTVPFYEKCGFAFSHRVKNFFTNNYDHQFMNAANS